MTERTVREVVVAALNQTANVFDDPNISSRIRSDVDLSLEEIGLDSLEMAEWALALEEATGLIINPAELSGATHLSDVERIISAKLNVSSQ